VTWAPTKQLPAARLRLDVRPHDAVYAVAIGNRERRQIELFRSLDELLGIARAFEKRSVALAPERHVRGHHSTVP
jgi:hypothetical protein